MHATVTARPRIARSRRLAYALATLAAVGIGALSTSASPALADGCPNEQLRSEDNSTRLPECRAYEMVTPLYKEGFPVRTPALNDEGALAYTSIGDFAGGGTGSLQNQYVARRSSIGWATTALAPFPRSTFNLLTIRPTEGLSLDFRSSLWVAHGNETPGEDDWFYYLRAPDGSMTRVGPGTIPGVDENNPYTEGVSPDLTHVVFAHGLGGGNAANAALYEYIGTGNEGPPLPVSVENNGQQIGGELCYNGMSTDGRVIVFGCTNNGVWARVGQSATVALAGSECTRTSGDPGGACNAVANADFAGMATDGSRVYFTTAQQLVNGDTDQTNDLYECEIPAGTPAPVGTANPCSSLTEVSGNVTGATVQSVVNVSEDGSRVYFLAKGVLAANLGTNDAAAVAGDNNLYVWEKDAAHPAGQTVFVAKLEANDISRAQTTTDGRYLVFETPNKLLPSDTDEATDAYRYDAETGTLLRLSTDTTGTGGNTPGANAEIVQPRLIPQLQGVQLRHPAITADGSTVVFETAEALSPADTDATTDVYAWHEGQVSLISNGRTTGLSAGGEPGAIGITPSGQDIFFSTYQPLTSGDSGTEQDFYDARVNGGFPAPAAEACSGEACRGVLAPQPQPPGTSASAAFNGPGSPLTAETPPANQPKPKPQTAAQKLARALKACRAKHNKQKRKACEKRARNTYRRGK